MKESKATLRQAPRCVCCRGEILEYLHITVDGWPAGFEKLCKIRKDELDPKRLQLV